jgi:hypothetical protein
MRGTVVDKFAVNAWGDGCGGTPIPAKPREIDS